MEDNSLISGQWAPLPVPTSYTGNENKRQEKLDSDAAIQRENEAAERKTKSNSIIERALI
jgi:hypothetical protein